MNKVETTLWHVKRAESFNSGGNVMLDIIHLNSGQILVISDELVCRYDSLKDFNGDYEDYDYDKQCVSLIED